MKYAFAISLLLMLTLSCKKETENEEKVIDRSNAEWSSYGLKGNVKSLSEKSYIATPEGTKGAARHENSAEHDFDLNFDENGLLVSEKKWYNNGTPYEETNFEGKDKKLNSRLYSNNKVMSKTLYSWDTKGNNITVVKSNPDNTGMQKTEKKFDNEGRLIETTTYNTQNNPTGRMTYSYDKKGNLTNEDIYMNYNLLVAKNISEYDKDNHKIAETRLDKNSKVIYKTTYKYDNGRLIEKETRNNKGKVEYLQKITFDEKGNETRQYTFDAFDNSETEDLYKYDARGNKIRWEIIKNKKPVMNAGYRYDDNNNLLEIIVNDADNKMIENKMYEYKYDNQGNWTRKVIYSDGIPKFIIERNITYYLE
jgi:YD repeat-containing protein